MLGRPVRRPSPCASNWSTCPMAASMCRRSRRPPTVARPGRTSGSARSPIISRRRSRSRRSSCSMPTIRSYPRANCSKACGMTITPASSNTGRTGTSPKSMPRQRSSSTRLATRNAATSSISCHLNMLERLPMTPAWSTPTTAGSISTGSRWNPPR
ncbi:hypothetical protein SDC9_189317 [bioreactor metagenome]|uniref:Uncharacterized protein n=1 Tax=bioreactor metagenome TaxID=1076179 RepID=A0A645HTH1_9ZZZZ